MTVMKCFVLVTAIANKTEEINMCISRVNGSTKRVEKRVLIVAGGKAYEPSRAAVSGEKSDGEYWVHQENQSYHEGKKIFPYVLYHNAEICIFAGTGSDDFHLVFKEGPQEILMSKLVKEAWTSCAASLGKCCFAVVDPVPEQAPPTKQEFGSPMAAPMPHVLGRGEAHEGEDQGPSPQPIPTNAVVPSKDQGTDRREEHEAVDGVYG